MTGAPTWQKIDRANRQVNWLIGIAVGFLLLSLTFRVIGVIGAVTHEAPTSTLDCVTTVNTADRIVIECQPKDASR